MERDATSVLEELLTRLHIGQRAIWAMAEVLSRRPDVARSQNGQPGKQASVNPAARWVHG